MTKYSDIEIQTAKNLLEKGFKWIVRDSSVFGSTVYAYVEKPYKEFYGWQQPNDWECVFLCSEFASIFQNVKFEDLEPTSLEDIVHPQILTDAEREYLSAVIKPFRNDVIGIRKSNFTDLHDPEKRMYQRISIILTGANEDIVLPLFESETKYKGMESFHLYSLEELGL